MDELQGLYLIDKEGYYYGKIERDFYSKNCNEHIIHYQKPNKAYDSISMPEDKYVLYKLRARDLTDRYDIINNRNIYHVYHFSPNSNTANILKYGILSREYADILDVPVEITDQNRLDGQLDRISTSISYPNYKMRYKLENQLGLNLVIYDISPRILLAKLDTQFYPTNAANFKFHGVNKDLFKTNEAFEDMFTNINREPSLDKRYTTDPQAEVLINNSIPISYIENVHTKNYDPNIEKLCNNMNKKYTIKYDLYTPRMDYRRW